MSNYNNLKTTIDANIKQNGNQEITGPILNSVLNQMVNILGTGYQFAGVATLDPATEPGTPDAKVFYIANGKGTYTNFGGIEVTEDDVVVLYWDSAWHKVSTGIASQEKLSELESKLPPIENRVSLMKGDSISFDETPLWGYYINGSVWVAGSSNYNSILIPRNSIIGNSMKIVPHTSENFSRYAFLKSNNAQFVDFCTNTSLMQTNVGEEKIETIPADCQYIYLYARSGGNVVTPFLSSIISVESNFADIQELHSDINGSITWRKGYGLFNGQILTGSGWSLSDKIPVPIGGKIRIKTVIFGSAGIGFFDGEDNLIEFQKSDYSSITNASVYELNIPENSRYVLISTYDVSVSSISYMHIGSQLIDAINGITYNKPIHPELYQIHNGGFIQRSDGKPVSSNNYLYTDFLNIEQFSNKEVVLKCVIYGYTALCFYDKDYNVVSTISGLNIADYGYSESLNFEARKFVVPQSAKYVRMSGYVPNYTDNADFTIQGTLELKEFVKIESARLQGKKILIIGDSISTDKTSEEFNPDYTSYGNYQKWVANLVDDGFFPTNIDNSGPQDATGYVARYNGMANDFITRLESINSPASYDMVVVFGGINDFIQSIPLGTSEDDKSTYFVPAVDYFYNYLIEHFTQARIAVMLPMRIYQVTNSINKSVDDYSDYIKEVAKRYCLPVLDLTNDSGFCPYIDTFKNMWTLKPQGYQTHDGVHPNAEYCQKYLAPMIKHFIEGLIVE